MNKQLFDFIKSPGETINDYKRHTAYYLSIFKNNKMGQWFASWNWACFFTSFIGLEFAWLFYRRMYFYGILIGLVWVTFFELIRVKLGLLFVMNMGLVFGKSLMWLLKILWVFAFTLFGNSLYGKHINQKLKAGKSLSGTDPYTAVVVIFLVYTLGTYAIMKVVQGNVEGTANLQEMINNMMNKNAGAN